MDDAGISRIQSGMPMVLQHLSPDGEHAAPELRAGYRDPTICRRSHRLQASHRSVRKLHCTET
jgi:hypothetical protein